MKFIYTIIFSISALYMQAQLLPADSLFALARAQDKPELALEFVNKATDLKNNRIEFYKFKGNLYLQLSDYEHAAANFKQAETLKEHAADYDLARTFALAKQPQKSLFYLDKHLKSPHPKLLFDINTDSAFTNIRDSKEWVKFWKKSYYNSSEMKLSEAKYAFSIGDNTKAFGIVSEVLSKSKNKDAFYALRGDIHFAEKNYKQAEKNYTKALNIKPKNTGYLLKRIKTNAEAGQNKKVIEDVSALLKLKPYFTELYKISAQAQLAENMPENAEQNILRYRQFYKQDAEGLYLQAKTEQANQNLIAALADANDYLKEHKSKDAFNLRGDIFYEIGMYNSAFKDYTMSLDMNPKSGEIWYKAGSALLKSGNKDKACHYFTKAVELRYYKAADILHEECR